jgi:hypothetical protein
LLQLAQLQTTTPNYAGRNVDQRPKIGGRWTDIALSREAHAEWASAQSGEDNVEEPSHWISPRRRSAVDHGQQQRTRADGSALASPHRSSAREQMALRSLDGGIKAAAPAVTTSSDSGRAQD